MIWIDITNSPHVLFFEPIIKELQSKGYKVLVTARDYQQTIPLLKRKGIKYKEIGSHYGKSKIKKGFGLLYRTFLLWKYLKSKDIKLSISHGSPYCTWASRLLRIKNIWMLDGDKARLVIKPVARFADKVIIPEIVPKRNFINFGVKEEKILQYPGLKEEVYLCDFKLDRKVLKELGLTKKDKIVVMRPEASQAVYYDKRIWVLDRAIDHFLKKKGYKVVLVPRAKDQKEYYKNKYMGNTELLILEVVDIPSLVCYADLVISGGGTINREAVVLGTPVLSIYQEELLTIDKWLIKSDYMRHTLKFSPEKAEISKSLRKYKVSCKGKKKIISLILGELK